ncbi:DNA-directed RNA polymerases II 24 kDa polypeptide (RNA polymerase II subunit 5) [Sorochytrium milnesiophthora]
MSDDRETTRLYRVYRTLKQMLRDRGYTVLQSDLDTSLEEFSTRYAPSGTVNRVDLTFTQVKQNGSGDTIMVFFPEDRSVGVKPIKSYCEKMLSLSIPRGIIVYQHAMTPSAKKARLFGLFFFTYIARELLTALKEQIITQVSEKYNLEAFAENELLVNITQHVLVPKHELLTDEQKTMLLQRYRLKPTQLPRIMSDDPVARYFGLKRGQVVKIIRNSETAGRYVTYRMCM